MIAHDHDEPKPRRRWPTYLAIVLVLVFVVYPLSIGPVNVLANRIGEPAFRPTAAFYCPLYLSARFTGFDEILKTYVMWWLTVTSDFTDQHCL
jgi:hypothetical protein